MDVKKLNKKFDVILLLGVLYTLRNPFAALEVLFVICNELLIVEAEILRSDRSICYVLERDEVVPGQQIPLPREASRQLFPVFQPCWSQHLSHRQGPPCPLAQP